MKKLFLIFLIACFLLSCMGTEGVQRDNSGTFRGKWWNYYNRGLDSLEDTDWDNAISDLSKVISKRPRDQRMARTYGMHFIDYFPHRELGIVYLSTGKVQDAINELETSLKDEESAKAVYYYNRARKIKLLRYRKEPIDPPAIMISSPAEGAAVNGFTFTVKGKVSGEGLVSKIVVNGVPYRFDLAEEDKNFEKEISVGAGEYSIVITAEDLLGNISEKTTYVTVDREGPTINIFDILPEEKHGEKLVRITGEINDNTGLENVSINNNPVHVGDSKSYEFDLRVDRKTQGGVFTIDSLDSLGNRTTARLDIEKELMAFNAVTEPVMLAFNGSDIFASDEKPPVIMLKGSDDIPTVFVDKYYVEGEVFDNKRVDKIVVNDKELSTKKGRKIFFSNLVKLEEGKNNIEVAAFDVSGNNAQSDLTIKREIPSVMQIGSRMSVSILPFEIKQMETPLTQLAYDLLIGSFVGQKRFSVIERTKLEQVLLEQKLTKEKLTDSAHSIRIGRLLAAETILATSVRETPTSIEIISRVINTETSEVMEVKDVYSEDKSFSTVKELMDGLASKIANSFPLVEGIVIDRDKRTIYVDIGTEAKIKKDMGAIFYRMGREIKHPVTGKSLGRDTEILGEGRIEEIHKGFSKIEIDDSAASKDISSKDLIITK